MRLRDPVAPPDEPYVILVDLVVSSPDASVDVRVCRELVAADGVWELYGPIRREDERG